MITTVERRSAERGRIPFEIPVELLHQDFDDAFEADAVDVSPGGLSLRSACLPEIGEQLVCSFETVPGGTRVSSRGEVVWTHLDGVRGGEFGLRFVDVEPQTRALIAEMVAERAVQRERAAESGEPPMAQLDLEGVAAPLAARLTHAGGGAAVFEQRLDLLELGRAVVAHAGSALGRGNIAEVGLRMDGDTPLLTVTVRFDGGKSLFGEFDWRNEGNAAPESDTVPDLDAPSAAQPVEAAERAPENRSSSVTMTEFRAQPEAPESAAASPALAQDLARTELSPDPEIESLPAALGEAPASDDEEAELRSAAASRDDRAPAAEQERKRSEGAGARARDEEILRGPQIVRTARAAPSQPELQTTGHDAWAHPLPDGARSSVLVRFLRIFAAVVAVTQRAGAWLMRALWPSARKLLARLHIERAADAPQRLWTSPQHLARQLLARASARPRRTTTAPAAARKAEQAAVSSMRMAVLAGLAVSAIALGAYALLPSPEEEQIPLHRRVQVAATPSAQRAEIPAGAPGAAQPSAAAETTPAPAVAEPAAAANVGSLGAAVAPATVAAPTAAASPTAAPATALNPDYARSMSGQPSLPTPTIGTSSPQAAQPSAATPHAPTAAAAPAASPYAVDVREQARESEAARKPSAPANAPSPSFGAKSVPNAQRFVLRMTGTIKTLQGSGDRSGFTVVVPGTRALDRAGPIRASHKAVAQAMVLNKGDRAELTIRFVEHKHPAYRVTGHGNELEVLIAP